MHEHGSFLVYSMDGQALSISNTVDLCEVDCHFWPCFYIGKLHFTGCLNNPKFRLEFWIQIAKYWLLVKPC